MEITKQISLSFGKVSNILLCTCGPNSDFYPFAKCLTLLVHFFQERHATLEKMGIDIQMSGIKVGQGKYYLVNLNADPSLNELLVYYLKVRTQCI